MVDSGSAMGCARLSGRIGALPPACALAGAVAVIAAAPTSLAAWRPAGPVCSADCDGARGGVPAPAFATCASARAGWVAWATDEFVGLVLAVLFCSAGFGLPVCAVLASAPAGVF